MLREAWTLAIETLSWMEMRRLSEPLALAKTIRQLRIEDPDAIRLARLLVSETVRRQNFIDAFLNHVMKPASLDEFDLGIQAFLRLYVYRIRMAKNRSEVDVFEAENTVKLARSILGWKTLRSVEPFLGMLLARNPATILEQKSDEALVALQTFHPEWFVEYCFKLLGRREAIEFLRSSASAPPICIRLNTIRATEKEILVKLAEEGVEVAKVEELALTYRIKRSEKTVTKTDCFKEGLIRLQDKADCFVAEAASPAAGMTVLDVCCAPGITTANLGQMMENDGRIIAVDYSTRRMTAWTKEVKHAHVKIAEPIIADARNPLPFDLEADMVVLSPPSTGTGMFGRLPSLKWRLTRRSVERMADVQWQLLNSCAEYLKPGGMLIYSTFSITTEENEMLIERFLKSRPEFSLLEISQKIGLAGFRGLGKCQRLYPHVHQCNGLFVAKLSRERS